MSPDPADRFQRFPTTQWTLVGKAGIEFDESRREALGELLQRYWPALKAHLLAKRRVDPNEADDLVQGFIQSKVLEKNLVASADKDRGKFRTLLATALDNYAANQWEKKTAKKRAADQASTIDEEHNQHLAATQETPDQALHVSWAREVLREVIKRMEQECADSKRDDLWLVFESRILGPIIDGKETMSYDELVEQGGFKTPAQASNALITAKRMFTRCLRTVVSQYAMNPDAVDEEIQDLQKILAGNA